MDLRVRRTSQTQSRPNCNPTPARLPKPAGRYDYFTPAVLPKVLIAAVFDQGFPLGKIPPGLIYSGVMRKYQKAPAEEILGNHNIKKIHTVVYGDVALIELHLTDSVKSKLQMYVVAFLRDLCCNRFTIETHKGYEDASAWGKRLKPHEIFEKCWPQFSTTFIAELQRLKDNHPVQPLTPDDYKWALNCAMEEGFQRNVSTSVNAYAGGKTDGNR